MTPEDCIFKLGQLEPDEIARLMKDSGVKAQREVSTACAVTQYVYKESRAERILTGYTTLSYRTHNGFTNLRLPETVKDFVAKFDDGCYPELDYYAPENM
ncbi:MAG TPA: hypothetical protein VFT53_07400 [Candidatus Saccharimonadales bacterium]|nr:hypothetical protein [Candidatus Saccharimonadales bacterium]